MSDSKKAFSMLLLITRPKLVKIAEELFEEKHIPIVYSVNAQGTAPNEIIDLLGLGNIEKKILAAIVPNHLKKEVMTLLSGGLRFERANSGIAFTLPITGASSFITKLYSEQTEDETQQRKEAAEMSESKYSMIMVTVNRGYTAEVMEAAREAGASGGSVIHSRRLVNEGTNNLWGQSSQEDKETVLIVADNEHKLDIMRQISKNCGIHSEARGVVLSFAIDSVIGLSAKEN